MKSRNSKYTNSSLEEFAKKGNINGAGWGNRVRDFFAFCLFFFNMDDINGMYVYDE